MRSSPVRRVWPSWGCLADARRAERPTSRRTRGGVAGTVRRRAAGSRERPRPRRPASSAPAEATAVRHARSAERVRSRESSSSSGRRSSVSRWRSRTWSSSVWNFASSMGRTVLAGSIRSRATSGFDQDLHDQRLVPERIGDDHWTRCRTLGRLFGRLEDRGSALRVLAYAPQAAATPHECSDGNLAVRRPILDVAVREPEDQDRRCRDTDTLLRSSVPVRYGCRSSSAG